MRLTQFGRQTSAFAANGRKVAAGTLRVAGPGGKGPPFPTQKREAPTQQADAFSTCLRGEDKSLEKRATSTASIPYATAKRRTSTNKTRRDE